MTNSFSVGGSGQHPRDFKAFGITPNTWLPLIKTTSETRFDDPQSLPPQTECSSLLAMTRKNPIAA